MLTKYQFFMGKFIITKRKNGEFQFVLKAGNGEPILASEGYQNKSGCENGIRSVQVNAPNDERYERKTASDGQLYFNLKAGNGEIIGTSERYKSESGRANGIASVKTNAPVATVDDQS